MHHALGCLAGLEGVSPELFSAKQMIRALEAAIPVCKKVAKLTRDSRSKDFTGHFRKMVYGSDEEMQNVLGNMEDDLVIQEIDEESDAFIESIEKLILRVGQV